MLTERFLFEQTFTKMWSRKLHSVLSTAARLEGSLDQFKITLGLPTDSLISLDPREFQRLEGITQEGARLVEEYLVAYALSKRMDYRSSMDAEADAARSILVAEDALGSVLDFSSALSVPSNGSSKPFEIDWDEVSWSAGFDLDLALDRHSQRNAYRRALVSYAQSQRATEQLQDEIKRDIRDTIRSLQTLEKSSGINKAAVTLAERRVKRTEAFMLAAGSQPHRNPGCPRSQG